MKNSLYKANCHKSKNLLLFFSCLFLLFSCTDSSKKNNTTLKSDSSNFQTKFITYPFQLDTTPIMFDSIDAHPLKGKSKKVFMDFDFSSNEYSLLGINSKEVSKNSLADSLGDFYTDDISTLKEIQKLWIFSKHEESYACGYHYDIHLCKNGKSEKEISINLECNQIVFDGKYFHFESKLLRAFYGKLKQPIRANNSFENNKKGREYINKIVTDKNLIMTPIPNWINAEGSFGFEVTCSKKAIDSEAKIMRLVENLEKLIYKSYPEEIFTLSKSGFSTEKISFRIDCNKSLYEKFKLFPLSWLKWELYPTNIRTYWKEKS